MGRVWKIIKMMKDGKAMEKNKIPNEIWKYGEDLSRWPQRVCNKVWRREGWPEDWKEDWIIIPIKKKGKGERMEDYKGMTLMLSLYKIYTTVLEERIKKEIEEKGILSKSQAGFRRGYRSDICAKLPDKQTVREERGETDCSIYRSQAFDSLSVERKEIIKAMRERERGVREGLVKRVEEMMKETKNKVRVKEKIGTEFWTVKGVR